MILIFFSLPSMLWSGSRGQGSYDKYFTKRNQHLLNGQGCFHFFFLWVQNKIWKKVVVLPGAGVGFCLCCEAAHAVERVGGIASVYSFDSFDSFNFYMYLDPKHLKDPFDSFDFFDWLGVWGQGVLGVRGLGCARGLGGGVGVLPAAGKGFCLKAASVVEREALPAGAAFRRQAKPLLGATQSPHFF